MVLKTFAKLFIYMKSMRKINLYAITLILFTFSAIYAKPVINKTNDEKKTQFKVEVKNSIGEPQTEVFLKISGRSEIYKADSCGIISFEYEVPQNYKRTANIYLNEDSKNPEKTFTLDKENTNLNFRIDTREDILKFKQDNSTFYIEGIVTTEDGEPITGATVSIQGTGRKTVTDEIGLFSIDADFNHYIIIRADGMENISMTVSPFLMDQKDAYSIVMRKKSGEKVYSSVETMPQYPGGMKYFKRYIDRNLKYPEEAKRNKIEGVVVMQFVVEKNGDITSPRVVRKLEASLDSVAMNLIKGMPRWTPASDHGVKVRCKYSVPIAFKIPVPKPVITPSPIRDVAITDSIKQTNDSIITVRDSLITDSLVNDSIIHNDSIIMKNDTIANDTTVVQKNLNNDNLIKDETTKVKKRNIFVRFFRWLFGIKDKDEKKEVKEEITQNDNTKTTITEEKEETVKETDTSATTEIETEQIEKETKTGE